MADSNGLSAAFADYAGQMFGLARRSLGDPTLAEEAVQETFMRAWRSRQRFDPELGTLRSWLFAIERRAIIDLARRRAAQPQPVAPHPDPPGPTDVVAAADELVERGMLAWQVEEALRRLRSEHRQVLVECYFRQRPGREVAESLGVPEGTVRSRLFYALKSLRLTLDELGWER